jgi:2-polyprenyl-3-methyl-5-hydroxy-6-metoxy-1,4-benzoquinol methylase
MYEKVEKCPLCNNKEHENYIICKDFTVSQESFAITKCTSCDFLFTNPRPEKKAIQDYYESQDYISHSDAANSPINILYKLVRQFTLKSKLKLLNNLSQKKTLLDYGCGTGALLELAQSKKWAVSGVEPNEQARKIASGKIGAQVYSSIGKINEAQSFDVITLWHVLEHVHDLNKTITSLKSHLNKKGTLLIALPNNQSLDQEIYREQWAAYDVPRHLYHFNQLTFKKFAQKHDLRVKDILPLKFDSYYVSLLSEKNKTGKQNYMKSFINGWKSNRWASKNDNNYSSLVYVLQSK